MVPDWPLDDHVGFLLRRVQLELFQDFQRRMAGLDLTPAAYAVLVLVASQPGIRLNRLADLLLIKSANCVPLINRLEKRSLVMREKVKSNGRAATLFLTGAGNALLEQAGLRVGEQLSAVRKRLSGLSGTRITSDRLTR